MIENKTTLGSIRSSDAKKRRLAKISLAYNVRNSKDFCNLFPEYVEKYNGLSEKGALEADMTQAVDDLSTQLPRNIMGAVAWVIALLSILVAVRFL